MVILNDNEIILLEDILYGDYFVDLIPEKINPFLKSKETWNITQPIKTATYINQFNMDSMSKDKNINQCIVTKSDDKKLSLGNWASQGLDDYNISEFKNSINCSWELFREILNIHTKENITISEIVNVLVQIYTELLDTNGDILLKIIKQQKKKAQSESFLMGLI